MPSMGGANVPPCHSCLASACAEKSSWISAPASTVHKPSRSRVSAISLAMTISSMELPFIIAGIETWKELPLPVGFRTSGPGSMEAACCIAGPATVEQRRSEGPTAARGSSSSSAATSAAAAAAEPNPCSSDHFSNSSGVRRQMFSLFTLKPWLPMPRICTSKRLPSSAKRMICAIWPLRSMRFCSFWILTTTPGSKTTSCIEGGSSRSASKVGLRTAADGKGGGATSAGLDLSGGEKALGLLAAPGVTVAVAADASSAAAAAAAAFSARTLSNAAAFRAFSASRA
mmetsp:Transcript_1808/g.3934  ORF Transcript_1808/g.3934 Transcript_1808/m.3934 type:complete len:286 (-) Transcript_1808:486-1343(-)